MLKIKNVIISAALLFVVDVLSLASRTNNLQRSVHCSAERLIKAHIPDTQLYLLLPRPRTLILSPSPMSTDFMWDFYAPPPSIRPKPTPLPAEETAGLVLLCCGRLNPGPRATNPLRGLRGRGRY